MWLLGCVIAFLCWVQSPTLNRVMHFSAPECHFASDEAEVYVVRTVVNVIVFEFSHTNANLFAPFMAMSGMSFSLMS